MTRDDEDVELLMTDYRAMKTSKGSGKSIIATTRGNWQGSSSPCSRTGKNHLIQS
ncbi:hypothetical protein [Sphaerochaeta halotolerans]|uniref:hypothetical protein n=1 Tax=Sphaerochaeta halotolerans TaxID=2293840 RepID=UPI001403C2BA|nr:hypothetical protein [Sphaerochaeta halotolerans]